MEKHMNGRLEEGPDASPNSVPTKLIEEAISTRQEAAEILLHNFKPIDADEDGFLSEDELLTVSNRQEYGSKKHEAFFLADNYVQQIQKLSNDELFSENSGLSKKDLEKLANADRRDYPFVEEFDKALAAFGKLTIEGIHDPNSIACDLLEGNGMSLELGLNNRNGFEDKAVLMAQVNKQISDLRAERSTLPTLRAEAWRDPFRRGDWVYSVINEKRGVPIYEQQFCPHNGNIYNARFRLVNPFNPR